MKNKIEIAIAIYAIGAVITYGHAWNQNWTAKDKEIGRREIESGIASVVWPLYWSAQLWKKGTQDK